MSTTKQTTMSTAIHHLDSAKEQLRQLVELFRDNIAQYKSAGYDEAKTRIDFIDKFFELLGWDVRNVAGYSEVYRDVVREDKVAIDNRPKAPDYAFRIGKERKFFVEAKKPSVNIHDDIVPAYQVRRYGYTAKLPLCILTDFEEFAVYDTRIKPHHNDKASVARIFYCKFNEYLDKFDFLSDTFSKEAVLRGSFDRFAQSNKNKKGTSEVDQEILAMVEEWRKSLAVTIAKQNPTISSFNLNTAVQRIVDRILFLRIAEDRRIERYEELLDVARSNDIYTGLHRLFVRADEKYNAGLFKQEDWLADIVVPDKVLAPIIKGLYYPISPYAFSVLPIEILGSIYERFLGKMIVLSPSHIAKVEEKPEVRKAGGVFYTPQYIVDYIVAETVGRKLKSDESKRTKTLPTLSIIDPACGSGSFLVGAYTFLLDEYLAFYSLESNRKNSLKKGLIYAISEQTYLLSIEEKQRILLANIFGVDIDPIAVEVTKLSLYLKLLENETDESAKLLFKYSDMKMLPNLDSNIRCGNSLIGSDFYRNKEMPLFGEEEIRRINAFDWKKEFPMVFDESGKWRVECGEWRASHQHQASLQRKLEGGKLEGGKLTGDKLAGGEHPATNVTGSRGGFDCVIGNPPYVLVQGAFRDDDLLEYYRAKYRSAIYKIDLYHLFFEHNIDLVNARGIMGIISPSNYLSNNRLECLRRIILDSTHIELIDNIKGKVFKDSSVDTTITILSRGKSKRKSLFVQSTWNSKEQSLEKFAREKIDQNSFYKVNGLIFTSRQNRLSLDRNTHTLGEHFEVRFGMQLRDRKLYEQDVIDKSQKSKKTKFHLPCYTGRDVSRWGMNYGGLLAYVNEEARCGGCWNMTIHKTNPKIIIRQIGATPICALDTNGFHCLNTMFMIVPKNNLADHSIDIKALLAILNSKLIGYYWQNHFSDMRQTYPKIKGTYLKQLPIPLINLSDKKQKAKHDKLVSLVDQMLSAQEQLRAAVSDSDRKTCTQRIEIIDAQIDAIVYELYGLTDDEIKIVEGDV